MKIAIIGAGAMGCLFGGYLARGGEEVSLIDVQPAVVAALAASGVCIQEANGEEIAVPVKAASDPRAIGEVDLVLFLTKSAQTRQAAESARCLCGQETAVLTLQNGLGNAERLAEILGGTRVLAGVTSQGCTLLAPGHVLHRGRGETVIGELSGARSARAEEIAGRFSRAGLPCRAAEEIRSHLWGKLLVNAGINALTAILRVPNGVLIEGTETRRLLREAVEEAGEVAQHQGIRLPYEDAVGQVEGVCRATAANFSSMLQDILAARETEVDFINGAIVREGERLGIETPVNRTLTALIKAIETQRRLSVLES